MTSEQRWAEVRRLLGTLPPDVRRAFCRQMARRLAPADGWEHRSTRQQLRVSTLTLPPSVLRRRNVAAVRARAGEAARRAERAETVRLLSEADRLIAAGRAR